MRSDLLEHELSGTASVFGRKSGVNVVIHGDQAMTDGQTVVLPTLPSGLELEEEDARVVRGFLDHESGHVRHTDFKALERFKRDCHAKHNTLAPHIQNGLEDVWLEERVFRDYPGARKNVRSTAERVDAEVMRELDAQPKLYGCAKTIGALAITWEGRKDYGHETGRQLIGKITDPWLKARLPEWVKAARACNNTHDLCELAKAIDWDIHEKPPQFTPPPPQGGKGKGGEGEGVEARKVEGKGQVEGKSEGREKGEDGSEGAGEGRAEKEYDPDDQGEAHMGRDDDGSGGEGGGVGAARGEIRPLTSKEPEAKPCNIIRGVESIYKRLGESSEKYRPYSKAWDKWHHASDASDKYGPYTRGKIMAAGSHATYDQIVREYMTGKLNVMRRKLERAIAAKRRRDWHGGYEHGRLDTRRLVQAYQAKPMVFKQREDEEDLNTAMTILIDLSGSMRSRVGGGLLRAMLAQHVAIALAEAIGRLGAPLEVLGFANQTSCHDRKEEGVVFNAEAAQASSRFQPLDMFEFKRFGESLRQAKPSMSRIAACAGGDNSDGEAVLLAYHRLAERKEERRILMTLSDGYPAFQTQAGMATQHLRDVVNFVTGQGVECVGIGIASEAVKHFYPKYAVVHRLDDLPRATIEEVGKLLVNKRYQADQSALMKVGGTI